MRVKNITPVLLVALLLTSCAPAMTVVSPTGTAEPIPTLSPVPPPSTVAPTPIPEHVAPTGEPIATLSGEGPWLLYVHNSPSAGFGDLAPVPPEFVLMNRDGSGLTPITLSDCYRQVDTFLMQGENSANTLAKFSGELYLFRPAEATGIRVYDRCNTVFAGDETGGFLASIYQAAEDAVPELIIYELPAGKLRDRFPLVRCGENANVCNQYPSTWSQMGEQGPRWSPNGRYLAFAAVLDADSSDLFVYDTQGGSLRRLTYGPDWVGPIRWTPDGTQIIMQEIRNDIDFFFAPSSMPPSLVWSVSVSTDEIKLLYSTDGAYAEQGIVEWLDEEHFVAFEGLLDSVFDNARNLRFVDMKTGTNRILFSSAFVQAEFDPIHETFALYVLDSEQYQQGFYLVSLKGSTIRYVAGPPVLNNFAEWDEKTGLFVSEDDCQNDPQSFQAFDYSGNLQCVPKPAPTPDPLEITRVLSPDGKGSVFVQDGLWLETDGSPAVRLSPKIPSDVIWCPDASCIFFSLFQQDKKEWTLYRVSLPDLTIKIVDEGIKSRGSYQWLGSKP